jgi:hypothetical protein
MSGDGTVVVDDDDDDDDAGMETTLFAPTASTSCH